jgi:hypothetical protein
VLRLVGNGVADGSPGCKPSPGYGWAGSRLRVGTGLVPHRTYINLCITVFLSYEQYIHPTNLTTTTQRLLREARPNSKFY